MPQSDTNPPAPPRGRALLRRILLALAGLIVLCALAVAALPLLVSSDFARARVEDALAKATGKPAVLRVLELSWSDGLRVEGLRVGQGDLDNPEFLASLDSLRASAGLLGLLRKDPRLSLSLRGLRLRLPPSADAPPKDQPPAPPLPEALRQGFDTLRAGLEPRDAAVNAHLDLDVSDVALRLERVGKPLTLRLESLRLTAPDLKAAPLELAAQAELAPADAAPLRLSLALRLDSLADASGRLAPARGRIDAGLDAPGLALRAQGSLEDGLHIRTQVDPRKALAAAAPLSASPLPEADGRLSLDISLARPDAARLDASLTLAAQGLRLRGGRPGAKAVGPLDVTLRQEARLDLAARTAQLPGTLDLGPSGRLPWSAELTGVSDGAPHARLAAGPARLELGPLLAAARAFLPPGLALAGLDVSLQRLEASALLPASGGLPGVDLDLAGLALDLRGLTLRDASGVMRLDRAALAVPAAKGRLPGLDAKEPGDLTATLSANLTGLRLDGPTPLRVASAALTGLRLDMTGLRQRQEALFGVSGQGRAELRAEAKGVEVQGKAALGELTASTLLDATIPAEKRLTAVLRECALDIPALRLLQPGKRPVETPLRLRAQATALRLSGGAQPVAGGAALVPGVEGLRVELDLGQALRCQANLDLGGPQGRSLRTDGRLGLDAARLLALAAGHAPRGAKASGAAAVDWRLSAELPAPQPKQTAAAPKAARRLSDTVRSLAFLHEAEAQLRLEGVSLDWPLPPAPDQPAETLHLRGLSTPRPFRLSTTNGLGASSLAGTLAFGPLAALPGVAALPRPVSGTFTLDAAQQDARSAQVTQTLRTQGLELDQSLRLSLDRLDRILDRQGDLPAAALELADATAAFRLVADLKGLAGAAPVKGGGLEGAGRLEAGAELRLAGGRSLELSASLASPGLDLRLGEQLRLEGLTADLRLSRRFALARGLRCPGDTDEASAPLSEQVFDQFPANPAARPRTEALGQLLRSDAASASGRSPGGSLGMRRLRLRAAGLPVDISDLRLALDDSGPVPGLRSFRAGLLGGGILGSALLHREDGRYGLNMDMAFTGIDPGRLLPDKAPRDLGDQAEMAGRLTLSLPLTPDSEVLLQRLGLRADLTRIGPRTLERMLYALDPEEKNEAIVQQRRLMGMGHPRWLRVAAAYGNLSVSGAVEVKGFQLDLPQVDRLPLANLPLRKQLQKPLAAIPGLVKALDAASGALICRDPAAPAGSGALRFLPTPSPQGASR